MRSIDLVWNFDDSFVPDNCNSLDPNIVIDVYIARLEGALREKFDTRLRLTKCTKFISLSYLHDEPSYFSEIQREIYDIIKRFPNANNIPKPNIFC